MWGIFWMDKIKNILFETLQVLFQEWQWWAGVNINSSSRYLSCLSHLELMLKALFTLLD
jgi:hypothetical protein